MAPSKSLASIAVILVLAVGLAAAGGTNSVDAGPLTLFALCGLIAFVVNWVVYVPSQLAQTEHYFENYKDLEEGKWVKIDGWQGIEEARKEIVESRQRYLDN